MVLMLTVHPSRQGDLLTDHAMRVSPNVALRDYEDWFGNVCTRLVAPVGQINIRNEFIIEDGGLPDVVVPYAEQIRWTGFPTPGGTRALQGDHE